MDHQNKFRKTKLNINNKNDIDNIKIRENYKRIRFDCGLTQEEMADKLGISPRCYKDFEEGRSNIINKYIRKMLKALELHIIDKEGVVYL